MHKTAHGQQDCPYTFSQNADAAMIKLIGALGAD